MAKKEGKKGAKKGAKKGGNGPSPQRFSFINHMIIIELVFVFFGALVTLASTFLCFQYHSSEGGTIKDFFQPGHLRYLRGVDPVPVTDTDTPPDNTKKFRPYPYGHHRDPSHGVGNDGGKPSQPGYPFYNVAGDDDTPQRDSPYTPQHDPSHTTLHGYEMLPDIIDGLNSGSIAVFHHAIQKSRIYSQLQSMSMKTIQSISIPSFTTTM
jgi:hypothetical protein